MAGSCSLPILHSIDKAGVTPPAFSVSVSQHSQCSWTKTTLLTSRSRKLSSVFEEPGLTDNRLKRFTNGAGNMRDNEPNKRIQALTPNKKQTATMKRRALKPKATKQLDRGFLARVQIEQSAP